jgi:hypothetical protein
MSSGLSRAQPAAQSRKVDVAIACLGFVLVVAVRLRLSGFASSRHFGPNFLELRVKVLPVDERLRQFAVLGVKLGPLGFDLNEGFLQNLVAPRRCGSVEYQSVRGLLLCIGAREPYFRSIERALPIHELQAINVVTSSWPSALDSVLSSEESSAAGVDLARNVVLYLMMCFDLMLQLYEFLRALINPVRTSNPAMPAKTRNVARSKGLPARQSSTLRKERRQHRNRKECRKVSTRAPKPTKPVIIPIMALASGSRGHGGTHTGRSALRDTGRAGFRADQ